MAPQLRPNKYAYQAIVLAGLAAVKLFRVPLRPVLRTGC